MRSIGETTWVVTAGRVYSERGQPPGRIPRSAELRDRDGVVVLNTGDDVAKVDVTLFFSTGDPGGPWRFAVPARSMRYQEFARLTGMPVMPAGTEFCAVLISDNPIVVQHVHHSARTDAGHTLSTLAYSV